jgi:DNA-binding NarL/FixJ family response regulator
MIRLLIADDHPVVREGLKRIVTDCADMQVVGEATGGDDVLGMSKTTSPNVVLLDLGMPGLGFLGLMKRLKTECPAVRVLVLSVQPEDQYAVRAFRAGAAGYLNKDRSPEELAQAIRQVSGGRRYITESIAERFVVDLAGDTGGPPHQALSDREYVVLCRLGLGKCTKDIAAELGISPKTVTTYRARILRKLNLKTNIDLVRYVIQHELVD